MYCMNVFITILNISELKQSPCRTPTFFDFNIITRKRVSQNGNMKVAMQASDN